jgi:uncharacterized protein (TIGR00369 family)
VAYIAREEWYNPQGSVQGGFIAAMLDDAMGPAAFTVLEPGQFAPTLELKVSYHRPLRAGSFTGRGARSSSKAACTHRRVSWRRARRQLCSSGRWRPGKLREAHGTSRSGHPGRGDG